MIYSEPFRLFFPMGIFYLLTGALLWLPQIWTAEHYPVLMHRYLVLNGFVASFIGGFLMTAVPRFSKTEHAKKEEVIFYFFIGLIGLLPAWASREQYVHAVSVLQGVSLLSFIFTRIRKRKENPPYSFVFIFGGLFLWIISSIAGLMGHYELFKDLHYEGAVASIILGVGSRLIPGILGHVEIVKAQRESYENPLPIYQTIPLYFILLIVGFIGSYFLGEEKGVVVRAVVVTIICFLYWRLHQFPKERTALTWSIWTCGWLILVSFLLRGVWTAGMIHGSHAFFISGIVLLSLLIATRVVQSHGPKDKSLENWKGLYVITFLATLAAATRVSAFILPENYLTHLGYSSLVLVVGVIIWAWKYLRYIR